MGFFYQKYACYASKVQKIPLKSNKKRRIGTILVSYSAFFYGELYGIQNQASIIASDYLGANLLCKFAAGARCAHTISLYRNTSPNKQGGAKRHPLACLVERTGFEPVTPTLPVLCAPNCANAPNDFLLTYYTV